MEQQIDQETLKAMERLQQVYKTSFEIVSQKVDNQSDTLNQAVNALRETTNEQKELNDLLKEVIAEKDVQVQRLMKATAALTVVTDQITERFRQQQ